MKHLWFGAGLLAALLVLGLWLGSALEPAYEAPVQDLEKAAQAALEEDWPLAAALSGRAKQAWEKRRKLTAALVNHSAPDQIDDLFVRLESSAASGDTAEYSAACAQLARQLRRLSKSHSFSWWNLL